MGLSRNCSTEGEEKCKSMLALMEQIWRSARCSSFVSLGWRVYGGCKGEGLLFPWATKY